MLGDMFLLLNGSRSILQTTSTIIPVVRSLLFNRGIQSIADVTTFSPCCLATTWRIPANLRLHPLAWLSCSLWQGSWWRPNWYQGLSALSSPKWWNIPLVPGPQNEGWRCGCCSCTGIANCWVCVVSWDSSVERPASPCWSPIACWRRIFSVTYNNKHWLVSARDTVNKEQGLKRV